MLHIDYITNSIFNSRTDDKSSGIKLALIPESRQREAKPTRKTEGQPTSCRTRTNLPHCDKSMAQSSVERNLRLSEGKSVFPGHEVV